MAFEGWGWAKCKFFPVVLSDVVRQKDPELIENLKKARLGDASCLPYFNSRSMGKKPGVHLLARNDDVRRENKEALDKIPGPLYSFETRVSKDEELTDEEFDRMVATDIPETLKIKDGAQVIITVNDYSGAYADDVDEVREGRRHNYQDALYYNGSRGTVVQVNAEDTKDDEGYIVVSIEGGGTIMLFRQRFNIYRYEISPEGDIIREVIGTFEQFPMLPSYALTVHRAQGQTLSNVRVSPDSINSGQLYVALSRATSVEGISIDRKMKREDLKLDPMVKGFYEKLELQIQGKLKGKAGRPAKSESGTVRMWVPAQLENHVKKEIAAMKPIAIYKVAKYKSERVQMRVPVEMSGHISEEIREWKKAAKIMLREFEEQKKSRT